jgi:hypothetical protein
VEVFVDMPEPICALRAERRPEDCHRILIVQYSASVAGKELEHLVPQRSPAHYHEIPRNLELSAVGNESSSGCSGR